jgi:hypothetical protein
MFNEIRMLAQPLCKTVEVFYDVIEMYSTKSQRELKKTFKDLRDQQTKTKKASEQQQHLTKTIKHSTACSSCRTVSS